MATRTPRTWAADEQLDAEDLEDLAKGWVANVNEASSTDDVVQGDGVVEIDCSEEYVSDGTRKILILGEVQLTATGFTAASIAVTLLLYKNGSLAKRIGRTSFLSCGDGEGMMICGFHVDAPSAATHTYDLRIQIVDEINGDAGDSLASTAGPGSSSGRLFILDAGEA